MLNYAYRTPKDKGEEKKRERKSGREPREVKNATLPPDLLREGGEGGKGQKEKKKKTNNGFFYPPIDIISSNSAGSGGKGEEGD